MSKSFGSGEHCKNNISKTGRLWLFVTDLSLFVVKFGKMCTCVQPYGSILLYRSIDSLFVPSFDKTKNSWDKYMKYTFLAAIFWSWLHTCNTEIGKTKRHERKLLFIDNGERGLESNKTTAKKDWASSNIFHLRLFVFRFSNICQCSCCSLYWRQCCAASASCWVCPAFPKGDSTL